MRRAFFAAVFCLFLLFSVGAMDENTALDSIDFSQLDDFINREIEAAFSPPTAREFITGLLKGETELGVAEAGKSLIGLFKSEMTRTISDGRGVLLVTLLFAFLPLLSGEGDGQPRRVCEMVGVFCLLGLFLPSFLELTKYGSLTIDKTTTFIRMIMPLYAVMLAVSGQAASAAAFPLSVIVALGVINELIKNIFMPLIYAYLTLGALSCASPNKGIERMADMLKGIFVWGLSLTLTFFGAVLALQKGAMHVADSASLSAIRYTISFAVPIVGKILSDSTDIVLGSAGVILGAFGIFGILVVILVCAIPVMRIGAYALLYKLLSIMGLMLEDSAPAKLLSFISNTFLMLTALSVSVSMLFIIAASLLIAGGRV